MKKILSGRIWGLIAAAVLLAGGVALSRLDLDSARDTYEIIYIPKIIDDQNDFWTLLIEGVEMAAQEYRVTVTIVAPDTEEDYERQNELIDWALERKPDAILLSPCSYTENTGHAGKITAAGIPLILIDSRLNEDLADAVVATDNVRLGEVQGSFMKQFVTEDSLIAVVGHVKESSTAMEREEGLRRGLAEYEERIADVVFCDSDYEKAERLTKELLVQYPQINLIAGLNEYSAVGAARAIKEMALQEQVKVVGTDSSLEEIKMLEEKVFQGIVIQNPFKMGYLGVEAAVKILNKEKVLPEIDSGCELITVQTVYTEENQKLIFPFRDE